MKTNITRRDFVKHTTATVSGFAIAGIVGTSAYAETVPGLYENLPIEDRVMGDINAPITLLEYASMTCPHCKAFHEQVMPAIKKEFIDTGKVKYILRPFPFTRDRRGEAAFMIAKCAPNNGYYPMLDALFSTQPVWARGPNPVGELQRIAKLSGMSDADFKACLGDNELLDKIVKVRNDAASKFGVRATPTLFINSERFSGPTNLENLRSVLSKQAGG